MHEVLASRKLLLRLLHKVRKPGQAGNGLEPGDFGRKTLNHIHQGGVRKDEEERSRGVLFLGELLGEVQETLPRGVEKAFPLLQEVRLIDSGVNAVERRFSLQNFLAHGEVLEGFGVGEGFGDLEEVLVDGLQVPIKDDQGELEHWKVYGAVSQERRYWAVDNTVLVGVVFQRFKRIGEPYRVLAGAAVMRNSINGHCGVVDLPVELSGVNKVHVFW